MHKAPKRGKLDPIDEEIKRIIAMVRVKVEHPFRVIKRQFGHMKTWYRGLAKNRALVSTLFALSNMFLVLTTVDATSAMLPEISISAAQAGKTMQKLLKTGCQKPGIAITGRKNGVG